MLALGIIILVKSIRAYKAEESDKRTQKILQKEGPYVNRNTVADLIARRFTLMKAEPLNDHDIEQLMTFVKAIDQKYFEELSKKDQKMCSICYQDYKIDEKIMK